ncbi:hypothetical protein KR093_002716 [Drosophila rubida]|uniref:G-patch domain-containing protein n=1 Tax=Drosophila rubida TaxID=30044 RepID=A0AAD4JYY8_9MUSC|nr:hypothetical protein KR093_002716 [Drosophila rubida]
MNAAGDELHPNWRALTTIQVPLKRFIRAGTAEQDKQQQKKHTVNGISGDEVHQFYQEILETPATRKVIKTSVSIPKRRPKEPSQLPFDRNRFFRLATTNNVAELLKMRIVEEQELNVCDVFGWTALMMAACEGAQDAVALLLQRGANTEVRDKSGNTALELAKQKNHLAVVQLLLAAQSSEANADESDADESIEAMTTPFFCELCQRDYKESTWRAHQTSTVHRFNSKSLAANKLQKFNISAKNRGLQLMVKQGWDREHGLGPTQSGRLYPVKTVLRKQRTGLGIEQSPARVTHFNAFDTNATRRGNGKPLEHQPRRTRNEMRREKLQEWRRERRLRHELS